MIPGRSTNITRELKLNRLVDENVEMYRDKFDLSVHIPLTTNYSNDFDEKFIEYSEREYNANFCKNIVQHIAKNVITKNISLKDMGIDDLLSYPNKDFDTFMENMEGFAIITNGQIGAYLQDFASYNVKFIHTTVINTAGLPYIIGDIHNKEIYVDPYMKWSDNRIFAIKKTFL